MNHQINLKKQSRKYLYNYQRLPTLKNPNAKLFALVTVAIWFHNLCPQAKKTVAMDKDVRRIKY